MNEARKKVFVGMSGGVDSSVSAALLKKAGYDVTGVFIKVWHPDWLPCEWKEERRDAMRVAAALDIPFFTFDFQEEYKKEVVDYMLTEYKQGRTPNPDVMCNKEIKFGSFLKKALEMGADYIATGHYVQIRPLSSRERGWGEVVQLLESTDKNKDQSYFLWTLTQDQLKHVLFPIGGYQKDEVRKCAKKFGLPTAEKKDSQGICFIGKVDMREFLQHYIEQNPGKVLDEQGQEIGTHEGAVFYTIGQRHGFVINEKNPNTTAYYIVAKNIEHNTITVSHRNTDEDLTRTKSVELSQINWNISTKPQPKKIYSARIRYRQEKQICTVLDNLITFAETQQGVSCGQSLVLYDGEMCIGGGIIEKVR